MNVTTVNGDINVSSNVTSTSGVFTGDGAGLFNIDFGNLTNVPAIVDTTLQQAYDASNSPEITTDATRGGVTFKRGSAADSDAVVEVQSGAGAVVWSVSGEGNVTLNGLVDGRDIAADGTTLDGLNTSFIDWSIGQVTDIHEDNIPATINHTTTFSDGPADVVIGGAGTIAGSDWNNGQFHIGTITTGWAMDSNEIYNSSAAIIGTLSGDLDFRASGNVTVDGQQVFDDSYHPNADTLTTARNITLSGDVTGSASFNGSSNITITATVGNDSHTHDTRYVQLSGDKMTGLLQLDDVIRGTRARFTTNDVNEMLWYAHPTNDWVGFLPYLAGGAQWVHSFAYNPTQGKWTIGNGHSTGEEVLTRNVADVEYLQLSGDTVTGIVTFGGGIRSYSSSDISQGFNRFGRNSTQFIDFHGGAGANKITGRSLTTNGKGIVINATTDESDTAPSSGTNFVDIQVRGASRLKVNDDAVICSAGKIEMSQVSTRDKYRVWNTSSYNIGMQSNFTYGGLGDDYAMTFQMNNSGTRGFWWGDTSHAQNNGAMSLTTDGKLTVANAMRLGYGEADTVTPGVDFDLDVSGKLNITNSDYTNMFRLTRSSTTFDMTLSTTPFLMFSLDGLDVARMDASGSSTPDIRTIITREKGDSRYIMASGETGNFETTGYITSGLDGGGISLINNDGYGNANITFNHKIGVPEQNGTAGRIAVNTDSTGGSATMIFGLVNSAVDSVGVAPTNVLTLRTGSTDLVSNLVVSGTGSFYQNNIQSSPSLYVQNAGTTYTDKIIARFVGDSNALDIMNIGAGDYSITNNQQNNGIEIRDGTGGISIMYNGIEDITCNNTGIIMDRDVTVNGTVTETSDERLKKNIVPISNAIEKVKQINGVNFNFISNDTPSSGVIAQDVEKVMPEIVRENAEGIKSVAYGNMIGLLIEAIKEQQKQIDALIKEKV